MASAGLDAGARIGSRLIRGAVAVAWKYSRLLEPHTWYNIYVLRSIYYIY